MHSWSAFKTGVKWVPRLARQRFIIPQPRKSREPFLVTATRVWDNCDKEGWRDKR